MLLCYVLSALCSLRDQCPFEGSDENTASTLTLMPAQSHTPPTQHTYDPSFKGRAQTPINTALQAAKGLLI